MKYQGKPVIVSCTGQDIPKVQMLNLIVATLARSQSNNFSFTFHIHCSFLIATNIVLPCQGLRCSLQNVVWYIFFWNLRLEIVAMWKWNDAWYRVVFKFWNLCWGLHCHLNFLGSNIIMMTKVLYQLISCVYSSSLSSLSATQVNPPWIVVASKAHWETCWLFPGKISFLSLLCQLFIVSTHVVLFHYNISFFQTIGQIYNLNFDVRNKFLKTVNGIDFEIEQEK